MPWPRLYAILASTAVLACSRTDEHEKPSTFDPHTPASTAAVTASAASAASGSPSAASSEPRPVGSVTMLQHRQASREPDWDLDHTDPARDYVTRYVRAVKRYGDDTPCVIVGASVSKGGQREVRVKNDPKGKCPTTNDAERDVFLVDVNGDRLTVDDPSTRAALHRWPDGSDTDAPAQPITSMNDFREWNSPLKAALLKLKLVPIRAQFYGRGSYPVLTLAGWSPVGISAEQPVETLTTAAETLCAANDNRPMAMFAGLDRTLLLRLRCPGLGVTKPAMTWEKL